jgi:hypothetical protein
MLAIFSSDCVDIMKREWTIVQLIGAMCLASAEIREWIANQGRNCVLSDLRWWCYIEPNGSCIYLLFIIRVSFTRPLSSVSSANIKLLFSHCWFTSESSSTSLFKSIQIILSFPDQPITPLNQIPISYSTTSKRPTNHQTYPGIILKSHHLQINLAWAVHYSAHQYVRCRVISIFLRCLLFICGGTGSLGVRLVRGAGVAFRVKECRWKQRGTWCGCD